MNPPRFMTRERLVWVLSGCLAFLAGGLLAVAPGHPLVRAGPGGPLTATGSWPWSFLLLLAGFGLADLLVVTVKYRGDSHTFSASEVALAIALLYTPVTLIVPAQALGLALVLSVIRRQRAVRLAFNLSQTALATVTAALAAHIIAGPTGPSTASMSGRMVAGVLIGAAVAITCNVLTVLLASAITNGRSQIANLFPSLPYSLASAITMASFGLVWAAAATVSVFLGVLALIPMAGTVIAYRGYVREQVARNGITFLYEATQSLHGSPQIEPALQDLLDRACRMFRTRKAEVAIWREDTNSWLRVRLGPDEWVMSPHAEPSWWPEDDGPHRLDARTAKGTARRLLQELDAPTALIARFPPNVNVRGYLAVADKHDGFAEFDKDDTHFFDLLTTQVAIGLENGELEQSLVALTSLENELRHQATHDALTGLANRSLLRARVDSITTKNAILLIDLDDFKTINDSLGHHVGDEVLVAVADRLRAVVRDHDLIARLGGDEFAILLSGASDRDMALDIAERVATALERPIKAGERDIVVGASVGLAFMAEGGTVLEDVLRHADVAMYEAKRQGKGRMVVFEAGMEAEARNRLDLIHAIHSGLETSEFAVSYQPIVDLATGMTVGAEALVRWHHPSRGPLGPDQFIPLAEESGLIVPLGRWIMGEALDKMRCWLAEMAARPAEDERMIAVDGFTLHVNVSYRQLYDTTFPAFMAQALRESGVGAEHLVLELTEGTVMHDIEAAATRLHELKRLGLSLALDDFGTGYSSLASLHRLPIDALKIDRTFVRSLGSRGSDGAVAEAIIGLAGALGMRSVAEGIESDDQLAVLRRLGCLYGQGYRFARPLSADRFMERVRAERARLAPAVLR